MKRRRIQFILKEESLISRGGLEFTTGEGNGTPLQYSCLENPMDGGAWWAVVHGSLGVGHDRATSLSLFTFMRWRRKWQPTPVFLPGESQGRGSLVGFRLWGRTESDRLKRLSSSSSRVDQNWLVNVCVEGKRKPGITDVTEGVLLWLG